MISFNQEIRLKAIFKSLLDKGRVTKDVYFKLCPSGSRLGILYGLPKVHKPCIDNFPAYTLKEESNAEETFAIFANSGKFAKVWCREIFYFREFAKVNSREKSWFSIRES